VCIELLVLPLTLPEGLPLSLQRLGQVGVFQALLGILLRQHLDLPLEGTQLLPETQRSGTLRKKKHQRRGFRRKLVVAVLTCL